MRISNSGFSAGGRWHEDAHPHHLALRMPASFSDGTALAPPIHCQRKQGRRKQWGQVVPFHHFSISSCSAPSSFLHLSKTAVVGRWGWCSSVAKVVVVTECPRGGIWCPSTNAQRSWAAADLLFECTAIGFSYKPLTPNPFSAEDARAEP